LAARAKCANEFARGGMRLHEWSKQFVERRHGCSNSLKIGTGGNLTKAVRQVSLFFGANYFASSGPATKSVLAVVSEPEFLHFFYIDQRPVFAGAEIVVIDRCEDGNEGANEQRKECHLSGDTPEKSRHGLVQP